MNKRSELNEHFSFLIVDDDERKIDLASRALGTRGIAPYIITGERYEERLHFAIRQIHLEGRFPVIFLDENFGLKEPKSGTEIARSLTESFKEVGGILFPFSNSYKEQCDNWWYAIEDKGKWVFADEGKLVTEYLYNGEIDAMCTDFLKDFNNGEDHCEIKNG